METLIAVLRLVGALINIVVGILRILSMMSSRNRRDDEEGR